MGNLAVPLVEFAQDFFRAPFLQRLFNDDTSLGDHLLNRGLHIFNHLPEVAP